MRSKVALFFLFWLLFWGNRRVLPIKKRTGTNQVLIKIQRGFFWLLVCALHLSW
uniref:Uncharacterized protein n=1 Tax=Setaria italica TaxID=4555 RepID=K3ZPA5_SETIT